MSASLPFIVTKDETIEVSSGYGFPEGLHVYVQIGPLNLIFSDLDTAAQVELAMTQARALLEPADEKAAMADAMEAA